jgi:hypothetical protein
VIGRGLLVVDTLALRTSLLPKTMICCLKTANHDQREDLKILYPRYSKDFERQASQRRNLGQIVKGIKQSLSCIRSTLARSEQGQGLSPINFFSTNFEQKMAAILKLCARSTSWTSSDT